MKTTIVFVCSCSLSWCILFFVSMDYSWRKLRKKIAFFGFFQKSQNMSHGNGCSTFVFQVMGILKPRTVSTDKGLQLSHSPMVGCNLLYGSNFDFHMTYFASRPRPVNLDHARPWLCPRIGKWTPPLFLPEIIS